MAEAPAAPAAPATPAAPEAPAAEWHGYTAPEDVAYVTTKGWKGPQDAIKSYRNAEQLIGRDPSTLITLPKEGDTAAFREVMTKLGLPASADKYDFGDLKTLAPGLTIDEGRLNWAKQTFHKMGLPANLAKQMVAEDAAYMLAQHKQAEADYQTAVTADKAALQKEWGGGAERMFAAAQTAAKALGFTGEMIDSLERSVGYAGTYKFLADLGKKLGEAKFVSGEGGDPTRFGDTKTPAEAKTEIDSLKLDPNFLRVMRDSSDPGHKAALEKWTKLHEIAFPG